MHVHVSVCMSLHMTDNPHVQGSFHQCEDAYRLVEVCLSLFNVARVVVEVEALMAHVHGIQIRIYINPQSTIIQYGLLGLVLGLGLGLGFILYCRIWRPLALPYMCPQPGEADLAIVSFPAPLPQKWLPPAKDGSGTFRHISWTC